MEQTIIRDHMRQEDSQTYLGEPQWWIYLESGRSVEITYETAGLALTDRYCSVRLHCTEEEFDNDIYHSTLGVIDKACTQNINDRSEDELFDEAAVIAANLIAAHHETIKKGE